MEAQPAKKKAPTADGDWKLDAEPIVTELLGSFERKSNDRAGGLWLTSDGRVLFCQVSGDCMLVGEGE